MASHFTGFTLFLTIFYSSIIQASVSAPLYPPLPLPNRNSDEASYIYQLEQTNKNCSDRACEKWVQYVKAILLQSTNTTVSCELFEKLSDDSSFPLKPMALIHRGQVCPGSEKLIKIIKDYIDSEKPPRWLVSNLYDSMIAIGEKIKYKDLTQLYLEAVKFAKFKKTKVTLLQSALAISADTDKPAIKNELYKYSPRLNLESQDYFAIAQDAQGAYDNELAAKYYEKAIRSTKIPMPQRRSALENLRGVYRALQKKKEALESLKRLWNWDKAIFIKKKDIESSRNFLLSTLSYSRGLWTEQKTDEALKVLGQSEKILNSKSLVSEIYFIRGQIAAEQKKNSDALKYLSIANNAASDVKTKNQIQWFQAWLSYKSHHYKDAEAYLEALKETELEPGKKSQIMYWLARTYKNLNKLEENKTQLEEVIKFDPLGYYALLAYRDLNIPLPRPEDVEMPDGTTLPRKIERQINASWDLFYWLVSVGENQLARQLLDEEAPLPDIGVENWEFIFIQYERAGYYGPVLSRVSKLTSQEKTKLLIERPKLLFPTPFKDLVDQAAINSGLWGEYILSIMRQESSYDPTVVSPANAFGLMQLLPSVAKAIAKQEKIEIKNMHDDLLDPTINIRLGAEHLRKYWEEFNGNFVLATAAYNASPDAIRNWVKNRYHPDIVEFIENIPYEETRTYVKLVLRNFINYLRLNNGVAMTFPEWCLQPIQVSNH